MTPDSSISQLLPPRASVRGRLRLPGDKSISHRALLFGALASGPSRVRRLGPGADVASTRAALEALGVPIAATGPGEVVIEGRGFAGLRAGPAGELALDCGNSGTTARLLTGLLAGRPGVFRLAGDESLSRRPMGRVAGPLARLGARIATTDGRLPMTITGSALRGAHVATGVASAQVKSALILAALQADGDSVVDEPRPTRDHTERMLRGMGVALSIDGTAIRVPGGSPRLAAVDVDVPGDPSSAAYAIALACLLPGSEVRVEGVSLNPTRLGFYRLLARMGASIESEPEGAAAEPLGTIVARTSSLRAIEVEEDEIPDAVDEIPLLAAVAASAEGTTVIRGAGELRVKESDRLAAILDVLRAFGVDAEPLDDGLTVTGPARLRPADVDARHDHRIAMCATVLAAQAGAPSRLTGGEWVRISYPGFFDDLERLSP